MCQQSCVGCPLDRYSEETAEALNLAIRERLVRLSVMDSPHVLRMLTNTEEHVRLLRFERGEREAAGPKP